MRILAGKGGYSTSLTHKSATQSCEEGPTSLKSVSYRQKNSLNCASFFVDIRLTLSVVVVSCSVALLHFL